VKIGVCAKVTPHADARIKIAADGSGIDTAGEKLVISDYDEVAVEQAIRTKEALGGEVVAFSVGNKDDDKVLRAGCLALGADKAVLMHNSRADALDVATLLANAIREAGCEIVFTGKTTTDDGTAQVGAMIAELLGWPQVSAVTELSIDGTTFTATRAMDAGLMQVVQGTLPAVITCEDGLNTPRYAKLPDIMKAKKKPLDITDVATAGGARSTMGAFAPPPARPAGRIIAGDPATAAKELAKLLREEAKVL